MTYSDLAELLKEQLELLGSAELRLVWRDAFELIHGPGWPSTNRAVRFYSAKRAWPVLDDAVRFELCLRLQFGIWHCEQLLDLQADPPTDVAVELLGILIDSWQDGGRFDWWAWLSHEVG